ncbi:MAG TPA: NTP transferase domain-containing protein [Mycobacteriales bacterium]|jgi:molybdopterin-guanine dinucleotide biosynthesis protein A|nr:NTP transferase domain-containing protein [Mycobacteriales bacterium]
MPGPEYDAIVLAGGSGTRMDGADKASLTVAGTTLLDRVLAAVAGAATVVVVGDRRPTQRPVTWTREHPAGTGPAAATRAGLALVDAEVVLLLAADLPFLTAATVDRLLATAAPTGAVLVDDDGRAQWLASAWPTDALRAAELAPGGSLRAALGPLQPSEVSVDGREVLDCDTPTDLARARELA